MKLSSGVPKKRMTVTPREGLASMSQKNEKLKMEIERKSWGSSLCI
jgi:hypothetical protein